MTQEDWINHLLQTTIDPLVQDGGRPVAVLSNLMLVCQMEPDRLEEAVRLIRLLLAQALTTPTPTEDTPHGHRHPAAAQDPPARRPTRQPRLRLPAVASVDGRPAPRLPRRLRDGDPVPAYADVVGHFNRDELRRQARTRT